MFELHCIYLQQQFRGKWGDFCCSVPLNPPVSFSFSCCCWLCVTLSVDLWPLTCVLLLLCLRTYREGASGFGCWRSRTLGGSGLWPCREKNNNTWHHCLQSYKQKHTTAFTDLRSGDKTEMFCHLIFMWRFSLSWTLSNTFLHVVVLLLLLLHFIVWLLLCYRKCCMLLN